MHATAKAGVATAKAGVVQALRPARTALCHPFVTVIAVLAVWVIAGVSGRAQVAAPVITIVKAARLIDGRGGAPMAPAMVRVDGERITAVGATLAVPQG